MSIFLQLPIRDHRHHPQTRITQRIEYIVIRVEELDGICPQILDLPDRNIVREGTGGKTTVVDTHDIHNVCILTYVQK